MKSIRKKFSTSKEPRQSTPLIAERSSPSYATVSSNEYFPNESIYEEENLNDVEMESKETRRNVSRSNSPTSMTSETEFFPPPKREPSWVTEARKQCAKEPLLDSDDNCFSIIDIETENSWFDGIWQALLISVLFLVIPSVIFALIGFVVLRYYMHNAGRSKRERQTVRIAFFSLLFGSIFSIFKDTVIVAIALFSLFNVKVSCYEVAQPLAFLLFLLLFILTPIMVCEFSGLTFGYKSRDGKSPKNTKEIKEKQIATTFMKTCLSSIHEVQNIKHQIYMISQKTAGSLVFGVMTLIFVLCALRSTLYWILQTSPRMPSPVTNGTMNATNMTIEGSLPARINDTVAILTTLNTFIMTFTSSAVVAVVFAWVLVILKLWRSFVADLNAKNGMVSHGVDGITAFWRVYQTLLFFSLSCKNPFVIARTTISTMFAIFTITLSAALLSDNSSGKPLRPDAYVKAVDTIFLIFALILSVLASFMTSSVMQGIVRELNLLKLHVASVSVSCVNERTEGEYQAHLKRFKVRNARSSLQILQEMLQVINYSRTDSMTTISNYAYFVVMIVGFVAVFKCIF